MCTLALYYREFDRYPLLIAANRDEYFNRPSAPPHALLGQPLVFGGRDLLAGGTWLGVNEYGLAVGILNRRDGKERKRDDTRSRGLLCLDLLKTTDPARALAFLEREKASTYQPFNLLMANAKEAHVAYNTDERFEFIALRKGVHVLSNTSIYDYSSGKRNHANRLFSAARDQLERSASAPFLAGALKGALSSHARLEGSRGPRDAICVHTPDYGTVSSTIILHAAGERRFHYYHVSGPPCRGDYQEFPSVAVSSLTGQ